jgi:hypothetical protein
MFKGVLSQTVCLFVLKCCTGSNVVPGKEDGVSENKKDGEYVLTYEDKDGDWMLVGDVPWE